MSVQIIIPVIRFATFAAFERLLAGVLLVLIIGGRTGPGSGLCLCWAGQLESVRLRAWREGGGGRGGRVAEGQRELREEVGGSFSLDSTRTGLGVAGVVGAGLTADKLETAGRGVTSSLALLHILGLRLYHIDGWNLVCRVSLRVSLAPDLLDGEIQSP